MYDVFLWSVYDELMSELMGQIQVESDEFWGMRDNFKFRVKIDTFDSQTDLQAAQDRVVRMQCRMKVHAYLIPERMVKNFKIASTNKKLYTTKKVIAIVEVDNTLK
jgi:hypothetical protein